MIGSARSPDEPGCNKYHDTVSQEWHYGTVWAG